MSDHNNKNTIVVAYDGVVFKNFKGNSAAVHVGRVLLGVLANRLALSGIEVGAVKKILPDGTRVIASICSGIHKIQITPPSVIEPVEIITLAPFFLLYECSPSDPYGRYSSGKNTFQKDFPYIPNEGEIFAQDENFVAKPCISQQLYLYGKQYQYDMVRYIYYAYGNQYEINPYDSSVWTFWHSPFGDLPLPIFAKYSQFMAESIYYMPAFVYDDSPPLKYVWSLQDARVILPVDNRFYRNGSLVGVLPIPEGDALVAGIGFHESGNVLIAASMQGRVLLYKIEKSLLVFIDTLWEIQTTSISEKLYHRRTVIFNYGATEAATLIDTKNQEAGRTALHLLKASILYDKKKKTFSIGSKELTPYWLDYEFSSSYEVRNTDNDYRTFSALTSKTEGKTPLGICYRYNKKTKESRIEEAFLVETTTIDFSHVSGLYTTNDARYYTVCGRFQAFDRDRANINSDIESFTSKQKLSIKFNDYTIDLADFDEAANYRMYGDYYDHINDTSICSFTSYDAFNGVLGSFYNYLQIMGGVGREQAAGERLALRHISVRHQAIVYAIVEYSQSRDGDGTLRMDQSTDSASYDPYDVNKDGLSGTCTLSNYNRTRNLLQRGFNTIEETTNLTLYVQTPNERIKVTTKTLVNGIAKDTSGSLHYSSFQSSGSRVTCLNVFTTDGINPSDPIWNTAGSYTPTRYWHGVYFPTDGAAYKTMTRELQSYIFGTFRGTTSFRCDPVLFWDGNGYSTAIATKMQDSSKLIYQYSERSAAIQPTYTFLIGREELLQYENVPIIVKCSSFDKSSEGDDYFYPIGWGLALTTIRSNESS